MGLRRGQLTTRVDREEIKELINEACLSARQSLACEVIGISCKTFQRWSIEDNCQDKRINHGMAPTNKLSDIEVQRVISVSNEPEYSDLPPGQIVPKLADKGLYIASESTFHRILKANKQLKHRNKSKPSKKRYKPRALVATKPNQIYTWDITYLPTSIKGVFFYLYLVLDVYSRKIVGWQVHHQELSELAADLMTDICRREKVSPGQVILHSDNGSPMKGATMLATLQELGVVPSFSRPLVSNDNPYSESLFRTLKYRPSYPDKAFADIESARQWVADFSVWYNDDHLHSGIKYVTPNQRHKGEDVEILIKRKKVYSQAKVLNPQRWSREIRNWDYIDKVHLNPEKGKTEKEEAKAA